MKEVKTVMKISKGQLACKKEKEKQILAKFSRKSFCQMFFLFVSESQRREELLDPGFSDLQRSIRLESQFERERIKEEEFLDTSHPGLHR